MKKHIGIWVDLRQACLVTVVKRGAGQVIEKDGGKPHIEYVKSDIEKHVRLSGGSGTRGTAWGPQDIADEKKTERRRDGEKAVYFKEIILHLKGADSILIFGPGEAKKDLLKEIERHDKRLAEKVVLETTDKMTENQIVAKTRDYFGQ